MPFNNLVRVLYVLFAAETLVLTNVLAKTNKRPTVEPTVSAFDLNSKPGHFTCPCGKSFQSQSSLSQHLKATGHNKKYNVNSDEVSSKGDVAETASRPQKLQRSKSIDRDDNIISLKERRRSIDELEKESIAIDKNEKRNANTEYSYYMRKIVDHIRKLKYGKIYSADFRKAGSHSVKTKIGKADEFDTNLKLMIDVKGIHTEGTINYIYNDKKAFDDKRSLPREMKSDRQLRDISKTPLPIPHGQVVVQLTDPSSLPHLTYNGELIPFKVLQDLHDKVGTAIHDLGLSDVKLSPTAQGPALTITIQQQNYNDINVDLVPSLPCDLPVGINGWPRKDTRKAFPKKIDAVSKVGLHLVPKGDESWTISYSKAERELLEGIDDNNECRREVMKIIKSFLEKCKRESPDGLPGLSSHIVKIQTLWSSEKHRLPGYWSQKYKDRCLLDTIDDLLYSLESQNLPEYFDEKLNILAHKKSSELKYFANCLRKRKAEIENTGKIKDEL